jgi:cyanophycin synthetase
MLRRRSSRSAFFAGSGRLQAELIALPVLDITAEQCAFLGAELARNGCLAGADASPSADPVRQFCDLMIRAHAALLREAGFFLPENAELVAHGPDRGRFAIAVPKVLCASEVSAELMLHLVRVGLQTAQRAVPVEGWLGKLRKEIAKVPQPFLAAAHMARAAYELELPILEWHLVFLQAGHGRNAVALTGSISERTSSIGVHLAREKGKQNELLARAGFPVASGGPVTTLDEARKRVDKLGFPVVVKPADKDGGLAVTSDIRTAAEFEEAFARAKAASANLMVEKHIEGTDYRLLFHGDELLVALERTPGGVTGNGIDTVAQLLEELNSDPKRGDGPRALLHRIAFDDEARQTLRRQGLTADSVPAEGQFVALRRAANHALGGMVRLVDEIHPDNIDLARRAMRLLRLDIAGLDLILPDVTRSWREAGGAICEVNAQPYIGEVIGRDLYKAMLQKLVPNEGRIPLVLVVGALDPAAIARLETQVPDLAVIDGEGARREGRPLSVEGMSWPHACQAALYDQETAAALCVLDPAETIPVYSPTDRFSAAVVLEVPEGGISEPLAALLRRAGKAIYASPEAAPALKKAKLKSMPLQAVELKRTLAALLAGKAMPAGAKPKPAPREKAPPARRKRR